MGTNTHTSRRKKGLVAGLISFTALALSGCFDAEYTLEYHEDNTSTVIMEMTEMSSEDSFLEDVSECEELPIDSYLSLIRFNEEGEDEPSPVVEGTVNEDGKIACLVTVSGIQVPTYDEYDEGENLDQVFDGESYEARVGNEFHVALKGETAVSLSESFLTAAMDDTFGELTYKFVFPGEVIEHSSGRLSEDKKTVTFDAEDPFFSSELTIVASAIPSIQPETNILVIILGVVGGLIILGAVGTVIIVSKRRKTPENSSHGNQENYPEQYPGNLFNNSIQEMDFTEETTPPSSSNNDSSGPRKPPSLPPPPPFLNK